MDVEGTLSLVFRWLWDESDLYIVKPEGCISAIGFEKGGADKAVLRAFHDAGRLRPHPSVGLQSAPAAALEGGQGVEHMDFRSFVDSCAPSADAVSFPPRVSYPWLCAGSGSNRTR